MAQLDPRSDPPTENRMVTVGYLNELYDKADRLARLERWLEQMPEALRLEAEQWCYWWREKPC